VVTLLEREVGIRRERGFLYREGGVIWRLPLMLLVFE